MQRLIPRSILALVLYFITISLAGKLFVGLAYLLLRAGSPLIWDWMQSHYGWRALIVGILAGIAPASLLLTVFLLFAQSENPVGKRINRFLAELDLDSVQPWIWLFFSPLLILIMQGWIRSQGLGSSVFDSSSQYSISSFVEYWNSELKYMDPQSHLYAADWSWMSQVFRIWLLATSTGYSLAPLLRKVGIAAYATAYQLPSEAREREAEESTMDETIDLK
jgi:MFS family permease